MILAGIAMCVPLAFLGMCIYLRQPFAILALVSIPGIVLGLWAYHLNTKKDFNSFFQILVPAFLVIFLSFDMTIVPVFNQKESFEPLFEYADKLKSEGAQLCLLLPTESLEGAAFFYLGGCIPRFDNLGLVQELMNSGEKIVVITRQENIEKNPDISIINSFNIGSNNVVVFTAKTLAKDQ